MSDSTQIGYRLRIQPTDLSTYPDRAKVIWFDLVVKYGLIAKDKDLAKGLGADGKPMKALRPKTIKYRKSEVGPVTKTAPPLIPALELSRVRSLLTGRAHTSSAEFWWKFDSVSGESFAVILRYQRDEYGRDVFGLSPRGTAWTLARATTEWDRWKASPGAQRLTAGRQGIPAARQVRKPIPQVTVRQNLEKSELFPGARPIIEKAMAEGRFPGFRRLNARGEQWKPQRGIGPGPISPRQPIAPTAKAIAERSLGVRFVPAPAARGNPSYQTVVIDVAKVAADLALSPGQYVGPGGTGAAIGGRYEEFERFLARAREKGIAIEMPRMYLAADTGRIDIGDGRHRFAVFRDLGATWLPVSVRRKEAEEIRRRYGVEP